METPNNMFIRQAGGVKAENRGGEKRLYEEEKLIPFTDGARGGQADLQLGEAALSLAQKDQTENN